MRGEHRDRALDIRIREVPGARGNADLVRQVWVNLIGNAVKYSRDRSPAIVEITGEHSSREVRYTVTDNGAGFDPRHADELFAVFQRLHTEKQFEGSGIGLALVHRIVTRHGGRVWAEGRVDEGATFGFALPAI